jgi:hypothetical protein
MIIDAHVLAGDGRYHSLDPGRLVDEMDRCGVDRALISPIDREMAVHNRDGNERVLAIAKRYPGRLLAYATANPWSRHAVEDLERALGEGAVAVKLHPAIQGFMVLEDLVHPLIEAAARHGVPVYVHTGTPAYALPLQLAELALAYPEVPFIMGKNGKTDFTLDAFPSFAAAPNLYGDTAHDFPERGMARMLREIGPERMIFSSNHPVSRLPLEIGKVRDMAASDAAKAAILGGTMAGLLGRRVR